MKLRHLGYACQNLSLNLSAGRTLRLANLNEEKVYGVIDANLSALMTILEWNVARGILFFRVSSEVVPFGGHEGFPLVWQDVFAERLTGIRRFAQAHDLRLSMHPGQYTVLNSSKDEVARSAVRELDYHAQFIRAVDPHAGTVTLHVGGAYGDKEAAIKRFKENFAMLSPLAQESLILENDDKTFHALDVLGLCEALNVRMVFDFFHHRCHSPGESWQHGLEAILARVVATWHGQVPKFHLSSLKPGTRASHADYIEPEDFRTFTELLEGIGGGEAYDLMLEAKAKDRAVLEIMASSVLEPGKAPVQARQ